MPAAGAAKLHKDTLFFGKICKKFRFFVLRPAFFRGETRFWSSRCEVGASDGGLCEQSLVGVGVGAGAGEPESAPFVRVRGLSV